MTYLTPGFWETYPTMRQKAQNEFEQNDRIYMTANRKIDFDILKAEKDVSTKESYLKDAKFTLWRAQKGFM